MSSVNGVVQEISTRKWKDKTFYSVKVDGDYYGLGALRPKFSEGDLIQFDAHENAKGYMDADTDTIKAKKGKGDTVSIGGKVNGSDKSGYWERKEARDIQNDLQREIGATRNTAAEWVKFLVANEAIKLPAAAKREEFLNALLEDYLNKFRCTYPQVTDGAKEAMKPATAEVASTNVEAEDDGWK